MMRWGNSMMGGYGYGNGFGYGPGAHPWFGLVCMALQAIFWIVVIVFLVKMYNSRKTKASKEIKSSNDSAIAILRERYAKGEINTEEYNQRKNELQ
jgi:putative membrane protein